MMLANSLSVQRLTRLILNEAHRHVKGFWLALASITLVFVISHLARTLNTYYALLYVGGCFAAASAFKDLHDAHKAHLLLMIPCSNLERFLSKWFMTSIGYIVFSFVLFFICIFLSGLINHMLWGEDIVIPNMTDPKLLSHIGIYLIVQSVFFLGGITFKRYALMKTFLMVGAVMSFLSLLAILFGHYLFCPDCILTKLLPFIAQLFYFSHYVFWYALAPFCLLLTYLKIREIQLK